MIKLLSTLFLLLPMVASAEFRDTFRIVDVHPNIVYESQLEQRYSCSSTVTYGRGYSRYERRQSSVAGAVIGGVIGNRFGRGHGRDAATVAGAVIGSNVARNHYDRHHDDRPHYDRNCRPYYVTRRIERVNGYTITYDYYGELRTIWMDYVPSGRWVTLP